MSLLRILGDSSSVQKPEQTKLMTGEEKVPANMELSQIRNYRESGQLFSNFKGRLITANQQVRISVFFMIETFRSQFLVIFFQYRTLKPILSCQTSHSTPSYQEGKAHLSILSIDIV